MLSRLFWQAIEDQNPDAVDYSDFEGTDIPVEHPLPEALHLSVSDQLQLELTLFFQFCVLTI